MHGALCPFNKTQEPRIALALTRTGKVHPETFYHINALRHWRRERLYNLEFATDITDYWLEMAQTAGPTRGPVHHVHKILKKLNIEGITPTLWAFQDGTWDITQMSDLTDIILITCRDRAWRQAGFRKRDNILMLTLSQP